MFPFAPTLEGYKASEQLVRDVMESRLTRYQTGRHDFTSQEDTLWKVAVLTRNVILSLILEACNAGQA